MSKKRIALVTGDGAAPEMMRVATMIAREAALIDGIEIEFVETPMGWNAYHLFGDTMPEASLKAATELGILFFGGVGDFVNDDTIGIDKPEMKPEARCLLTLRHKWGLLVNFRPVIYYKSLFNLARVKINQEDFPEEGIRQIWVRFLLQDSYFGNQDLLPRFSPLLAREIGIKKKAEVNGHEEIVVDMAYYMRETLEKFFRAVFQHAKELSLPVISVNKRNVLARYEFWARVCNHIQGTEFPEIYLQHLYVDSANSLLFNPAKLNAVIACGNEHGDILSDGAAEAMGSLGMMCSSAISPDKGFAMFESGAGTAPNLAGKDRANPIGRILTAALMLRHIGAIKGAEAIEGAVNKALENGIRTRDIFDYSSGNYQALVGTSMMGKIILRHIREGHK